MNNDNEWQRLYNVLALSPEQELFINCDLFDIDLLCILHDQAVPSVINFHDTKGSYIPIDNAIKFHVEESLIIQRERVWHSVVATELESLKRRFNRFRSLNVEPKSIFSHEFLRQVYAKAEREGNLSGMRNLEKSRPDLFGKNASSKLPTQRKRVKRENRGKKDVYFIQGCETKRIKIGVSNNVENRITQLASSEPLELLGVIKGGGEKLERKLHTQFKSLQVHREWFKPEQELLEYIENSTTK